MLDTTARFLCIASYEKGQDFLRQCAEMGVKPTLLTLDKLRDGEWPREALEDLVTMPSGLNREQILNTVSWMARGRRFDRIVALDEFDLEKAAQIREHMRIPGMGTTTAGCYRDKLAMRTIARSLGFLVPEFCRVLNYDELRDYMERVPPPWLLKPRSEASALGIRGIAEPEQLWRILDDLGDEQSHYLLEQFVPGDIFHVDSIVSESEVKFQVAHQYGRPPMQVMHEGGVFTTRTVDRDSRDARELTALNASLAVTNLRGEPYVLPDSYETYAGSVLCLAQTAQPDTGGFDDPEIVVRLKKHHHAGLIVRSSKPQRVKELLEQYSAEFTQRFLASASPPPPDWLTPA
jgi:hypothetical protein